MDEDQLLRNRINHAFGTIEVTGKTVHRLVHKWMGRWWAEGEADLHDRSSRPCTTPHRTKP